MANALGDKVRDLRKKKGLTLEELAHAIGSGKSYIWELENKGVKRPSAEKLNEIAKILGVTPEYLTDESAEIIEDDAVDQAFFRKYQKMPPETKDKIRKTIALLWEDED
jgi:transcriptional regulator with XRE-family HTH domain